MKTLEQRNQDLTKISGWNETNINRLQQNIEEKEFFYNGRVYSIRQSGDIDFLLPNTIYSSVMIYPLLFRPYFHRKIIYTRNPYDSNGQIIENLNDRKKISLLDYSVSLRTLFGIISNIIAFILCITSQIICLIFLNKSALLHKHNEDQSCKKCDFILLVFCLGLFIVNVGDEMSNSLSIRRFIQELPVWDEAIDFTICNKLETCLVLQKKRIKTKHKMEFLITLIQYGGITCIYRVFMYSLFIIKLMIELFLLWIGSSFILYADDNESIIVNTLSMTFIVNIDNFVYSFFLSNSQKKEIEGGVPVIQKMFGSEDKHVSIGNKCNDILWEYIRPIIIFMYVFISSFILYMYWCK